MRSSLEGSGVMVDMVYKRSFGIVNFLEQRLQAFTNKAPDCRA